MGSFSPFYAAWPRPSAHSPLMLLNSRTAFATPAFTPIKTRSPDVLTIPHSHLALRGDEPRRVTPSSAPDASNLAPAHCMGSQSACRRGARDGGAGSCIRMCSANTDTSGSGAAESGCGGNWRQCAGAIIFNRRAEVLIGRRKDNCDNWQFPQGGIEDGENPAVAATREVYEEMGIRSPGHVLLVGTLDEVHAYKTPEGSWLHQQGFIGQHLHWTLFYYPGPEEMPPVDVSGLGGEKQEFVGVDWVTWETLLPRTVWFKRDMYEALQQLAAPVIEAYVRQQQRQTTSAAASSVPTLHPRSATAAASADADAEGKPGSGQGGGEGGEDGTSLSGAADASAHFRVSRLMRE